MNSLGFRVLFWTVVFTPSLYVVGAAVCSGKVEDPSWLFVLGLPVGASLVLGMVRFVNWWDSPRLVEPADEARDAATGSD